MFRKILCYLIILFCVLAILSSSLQADQVQPYISHSEKEPANVDKPVIAATLKRFEETAPTFIKFLLAVCEVLFAGLWMIESSLNVLLWLLNQVIITCTDVCTKCFGFLFNVMKILEAFGFIVKFLLELNYAALSWIFNGFNCIRSGFKDVFIYVKITIHNQTEQVYESSTIALEGVGSLFLHIYNQTWIRIQYISSILSTNFHPPFGLSAVDTSLLQSLVSTGLEFFMQSIKMSGVMLKDASVSLISYLSSTFYNVGGNILEKIIACVYFINEVILMIINLVVYVAKWPFYFLTSLISNGSYMLLYSWEAFLNYLSYVDFSVREILYSIIWINGVIFSSIVTGIGRCSGNILQFIKYTTLTTVYGFIEVFKMSPPFTLPLLCASCIFCYWRKEILAKLLLSTMIFMNGFHRMFVNVRDEIGAGSNQVLNTEHIELPEQEIRYREQRLCVICQENEKSILLLPCRHVCMCSTCLQGLQGRNKTCPLCRSQIRENLEVFL